ncbi:MAG: Rne/Rng family ribonuclease [Paracoccaceae bacterium]
MPKKMLIDAAHAEETRVVVVDGNRVEEFDFESETRRQLAGNIYLAKVTRVEPSLQAAFVDYGGNRHGFLAFSEIHPDYYQIPIADREALMEEERAYAEALREQEENAQAEKKRSRVKTRSKDTKSADFIEKQDINEGDAGQLLENDVPGSEDDQNGSAGKREKDDSENTLETNPDSEADPDNKPAAEETTDIDQDDSSEDSLDEIESVSEADDPLDLVIASKPRPRRYKIQEVIKVRQILLVQVVKEERGNKGAALTTYLSLAGRYCVLMPNTARGGGISRKITNAVDRKKLKEIAGGIEVPSGAGLIVRTAGAKRTKTEIKRDYEYLQRLWEQIRELTLKSIAPTKIYEEGDLVKRSIRDLYNRDIDEVLVEGEAGYKIAKDFMRMIMPSHSKNVKHYNDPLPLFSRYQVETYLTSMFNPVVQLKSGGYLVIGVTEALVAIDVNSGRATKEGSIEDTALKTNLEAAEEVSRQLRLRDLAGLIVIDFIDMEDRRNNSAVERKLKDKLKTDRARIQVGRISGFGLLEMSRQRLRPGMIEATTQNCPHCHGTGLIRSEENLALSIIRQIEDEGVRGRSREVVVNCPVSVANFIVNQKRDHIANIEARFSLFVRINADTALVSPEYSIEKLKTSSRPPSEKQVSSELSSPISASDLEMLDENDSEPSSSISEKSKEDDESKPKKRRRRRRRKPRTGGDEQDVTVNESTEKESDSASVGLEIGSEINSSISAEPDAGETNLSKDDELKSPESKRKRTTRKVRKSDEKQVRPDNVNVKDGMDVTATELPKNENDVKKSKAKTNPRGRKKATKEDAIIDDQGILAETASVPKIDVSEKKEEKKDTKVTKPKSGRTKKVTSSTDKSKNLDREVKQSDLDDQSVSAKEETKKTRRRGWWSKNN